MFVSYLLSTIGFVFYYLYDINSITYHYKIAQSFFMIGSVFLVISTLNIFILYHIKSYIMLGLSFLFFILLMYTLFFALPFDETYCQDNHQRLAYTKGVYALCRHPGVLWFSFMYILLTFAFKESMIVYTIIMITYNLIYILLQDFLIFPRTFSNYNEYKKTTPFLIPRIHHIRECFHTLRGEKSS